MLVKLHAGSKLQSHGPIVDLLLYHKNTRDPEKVKALIDTGSSHCAITYDLAKKMSIEPYRSTSVSGSNYKSIEHLFMVRWSFQAFPILVITSSAHGFSVEPKEGIEMIIGRNVLCNFIFTYDGPNQSFELRLP